MPFGLFGDLFGGGWTSGGNGSLLDYNQDFYSGLDAYTNYGNDANDGGLSSFGSGSGLGSSENVGSLSRWQYNDPDSSTSWYSNSLDNNKWQYNSPNSSTSWYSNNLDTNTTPTAKSSDTTNSLFPLKNTASSANDDGLSPNKWAKKAMEALPSALEALLGIDSSKKSENQDTDALSAFINGAKRTQRRLKPKL